MREMQNLEYSYIVRELARLEGKHFSKIYPLGEKSFRIKIGDAQIIVDLPIRAGIAKYIGKGGEPTGFTEKLKKILDNQKLLKACQCGKDRILALEFEKNVLFLEMFAKGNIVLTDKSGKIIEVFRDEKWKDRTLTKGEGYKEPQSQSVAKIGDALSEKYAVVCLLKLPLGKEYAREMLAGCGVDEKKAGNSLTKDEISCLERQYADILQNQKPFLFLENGKPIDYGLVKFRKYETQNAKFETRPMPSLSEAMEEFYAHAPKEKKSGRMEKLERRLAEQLAALERLKTEEKEAKEKGDYIYVNYEKAEEILRIAKEAGINNIHEALKKYKLLKISREKKEMELEL